MIDDATASAYVKAIETMFSGLPVAKEMSAFAASVFFAEGDEFLLGEVSTEGFHFLSLPTNSR